MSRARPSILFVGPMLGQSPGWVPNPMESLAPRLETLGYRCELTSRTVERFARWRDIVSTVVRQRDEHDLLCLQVYTGPSFVVEDSVTQLATLLRKPVVMVLHGGDLPRFSARFPAWVASVLGRADSLVAPSNFLAEAVAAYGLPADVIPNMIPIDEYQFTRRERPRPRLLWMRTFHPLYNPGMALRVLAVVRRRFPEATLTMAGQKKGMLAETRQLASDLGLERAVTFAGFADAEMKAALFKEHDIFLNTNRVDNMPVSVVEACACGLPVVATDVGGLRHLLRHGESGWLVPDRDVGAMASGVCRLLEDESLAARLSSGGRAVAQESAWENVRPKWERVFERTLN